MLHMQTIRRYLLFIYCSLFLVNDAMAQVSSSLKFDGINDHVQFSQHIVPNSGDFTIEFWCYLNNTGSAQTLISQGVSGDAFYVSVGSSGMISLGDDWLVSGAQLPFLQWVHVAIVKSGTNGKLYINGVLFTSTSGFSAASGGAFTRLGVQTDGTSEFANVFLDELRIWNVERTVAEIQAMKNCQMNASLSALTANYHFDNGIADGNNSSPAQITLSGQTGSPANDGTLSGFGLTGTNSNWVSFASIASGNSCSLFFADTDADGFGDPLNSIWAATTPSGFVANAGDCDDSNGLIFPDATERCNAIDDDCDLAVDDSVEIPKIFTNRSPILCQGESIQLSTVLPGNFAWSNGLINASLIVVSTSGDYVLTNTATNCSSDTLSVLFNTASTTPVITPLGSTEFCNGDFAVLSASPAQKYFWSNGDSLSTIQVYTQSTISLTVLDTGSVCISQPSSPVSLTVNLPTPPPTIQNFGPNNLCASQTTFLNIANGPFPYQSILWNNGSTGTSISVGPGIYSARAVSFNGCISLPSPETAIFEILPASRPIIELQTGYTNPDCGNGLIGLVASGGSSSYLWSNNSFGQFLNATVSGKYSVKGVTNGCFTSPSDSFDVQIFPPHPTPDISANGPLLVCTPNGLQLTSSPSFKYSWSNGETTQTITVNKGGSYFVRTTDVNGCSAQSNAVIVDGVVNGFRDAFVLSSGPLSFCQGDSVLLTASTAIGFMENGYLWSNGATTKSIKVYNQGDYSVTVSFNNGCTSPQSGIVPVRVSATSAAPAIYTYAPLNACLDGNLFTLYSTSASNNLWSTGQTTQSIFITSGGTFTVTATNSAGCVSGTSAPLTIVRSLPVVPVISASGSLSFCLGDSVILTSSSPINNLWSNGEVTQSITVRKSGVISVQYLDSLGCLSVTSAPVSVNANPLGTIPSINLIASPVLCAGESAQLSTSSASAILWNTGATTSSITVNTTGYYKAQTTNLFGCTSPWSDSIYLYFNPVPSQPIITSNAPVDFCDGASVRLTSTEGYAYIWSDGDAARSKLINNSGAYSVRIEDSLGCISPPSDTIFATKRTAPPKPILSTEGIVTICGGEPGFFVSSSPAAGYLWSTGETTASVMLPYDGSYSVRAIDAFGCKSEPSNLLNVVVNNSISIPGFQFTSNNVCEGDSILLTSNTPFNNVWSTGDTTRFLYVKTGGNYTLTVNDSSNCLSGTSNPFSVTLRPRPETPVLIADGPTEFCAGGSVIVSAPYFNNGQNYIWSDGVYTLGPGRFASVSGTLSVVRIDVSGFGCKSLPSNELSIVVNPLPTAPSITADGPTVFCTEDSVVLTSSIASGNVWSSGDTTQNAVIKVSGTVNLFLVDENGCQSPSVFQLVLVESPATPPVINTSGLDTVLCQGETTILSATGGSSNQQFVWNIGVSPFGNILSVNSTGSYYAYFVSSNGCVSANSDTVDIVVHPNPAKPAIVSAGPLILNSGNNILCSNDSLVLSTALPAYEYKWEAGGFSVFSADSTFLVVNPPLVAFGGKAYTVTVRDSFGCVSPMSDAIVVGGQTSPVASISLAPNQQAVFCEGGSTIITANVLNQNYLWSNGQTTFSFPVDSSGIYTLTVTDNIGCASEPSAPFTVNELPNLTWYRDNDFDGFGDLAVTTSNCFLPAGYVSDSTDCYDFNPLIINSQRYFADTDNDGYGDLNDFVTVCVAPSGYVSDSLDCNDTDNQIHPGGFEKCNAVDDDCDQLIDDGVVRPVITASGTTMICAPGSVTLTSDVSAGNIWNTGALSSSITVLQGGIYYVTNSINLCTSDTLQVIGCFELIMHQAIASAGKDISGSNGNVSFTVGQPFFVTKTGSTGKVRDGIQQPYVSPSGVLNVFVFLQGFYQPGNTPLIEILGPGICDTITVNLHAGSAPYAKLYSKKVLLSSSGTASLPVPSSLLGSSYFISIQHRNSIETWSKQPVMLGASTGFDFTH